MSTLHVASDHLAVYRMGLVFASICTGLPKSEVEREMNLISPTGISSGWTISDDAAFSNGPANGCVCEQDPTRRHYLMEC